MRTESHPYRGSSALKTWSLTSSRWFWGGPLVALTTALFGLASMSVTPVASVVLLLGLGVFAYSLKASGKYRVVGGRGEFALTRQALCIPHEERHERIVLPLQDLRLHVHTLQVRLYFIPVSYERTLELRVGKVVRRLSERLFDSPQVFDEVVRAIDHVQQHGCLPPETEAVGTRDHYDEQIDRELADLDH